MDTFSVLHCTSKLNQKEEEAGPQGGQNCNSPFTVGERHAGAPISGVSLFVDVAVSHDILFTIDWKARATALQAAVAAAEVNRVNSHRAKRLLRELHAYVGAASATRHLEAVMARTPCGTAPLRSALTHLEESAAALSTTAHPMLPPHPSLMPSQMTQVRCCCRRRECFRLCHANWLAAVSPLCRTAAVHWRALSSRKGCATGSPPKQYAPACAMYSSHSWSASSRCLRYVANVFKVPNIGCQTLGVLRY